jgi:purine-nucleoside phosphorylase
MTSDRIKSAAAVIRGITDFEPKIAVVLGSGLGDYADTVEGGIAVDYSDITGFPAPTTPGHKGRLVFGAKHGKPVVVMQGRFHCYEGYTPQETVIPLRTLIRLGVKTVFLTNAAGGVNEDFRPGDLCILTDHIDFASKNPLVGPNLDEFGPRFPDMTFAYNKELTALLGGIGTQNGIPLQKGVYAYMSGPSFETPAEIRALRKLGADLVGMSTVPEIIAAAHAGARACAVSCVTNMAAGILNQPLTHEEVLQAGLLVKEKLQVLVDEFIKNVKID